MSSSLDYLLAIETSQFKMCFSVINQLFCSFPIRDCFMVYVDHKFRASIGKSHLIRDHEKVLLAFSGGHSSSALLHLVQEVSNMSMTQISILWKSGNKSVWLYVNLVIEYTNKIFLLILIHLLFNVAIKNVFIDSYIKDGKPCCNKTQWLTDRDQSHHWVMVGLITVEAQSYVVVSMYLTWIHMCW